LPTGDVPERLHNRVCRRYLEATFCERRAQGRADYFVIVDK
jgi:hypothetical protein